MIPGKAFDFLKRFRENCHTIMDKPSAHLLSSKNWVGSKECVIRRTTIVRLSELWDTVESDRTLAEDFKKFGQSLALKPRWGTAYLGFDDDLEFPCLWFKTTSSRPIHFALCARWLALICRSCGKFDTIESIELGETLIPAIIQSNEDIAYLAALENITMSLVPGSG